MYRFWRELSMRNINDLNPDYKGEDKTYTDEDGNPLPTVG